MSKIERQMIEESKADLAQRNKSTSDLARILSAASYSYAELHASWREMPECPYKFSDHACQMIEESRAGLEDVTGVDVTQDGTILKSSAVGWSSLLALPPGEVIAIPEDPPVRRMAILEVSPEMFRELFQLPPGCEVVGVSVPFDRPGLIEISIRGAGWPTPPGAVLQHTTGALYRGKTMDGERMYVIDWKMPA